jgi:flagellar motility protein MotE (MotC chaperone)
MKDKLLPNTHFPLIVGLTALLIAFCAVGFSVYGIATLFAGALLYVAFMAGALEIGKFVAAVYIYRYWNKLGFLLKSYLVSAVAVLMIITSLGIFGFLSSAYQASSLEFSLTQNRIQMTEDQKSYHFESITNATARIAILNDVRLTQEKRLSDAQTDSFLTRNPIQLQQLQAQTAESISTANAEIREKTEEIRAERIKIQELDEQVAALKIGSMQKKDIQTFQYVADQLGWELDKVAFWFMIAIIFVFDPLAIALILAYNVAVFRREKLGEINPLATSQEIPTVKEIITDAERSQLPKS